MGSGLGYKLQATAGTRCIIDSTKPIGRRTAGSTKLAPPAPQGSRNLRDDCALSTTWGDIHGIAKFIKYIAYSLLSCNHTFILSPITWLGTTQVPSLTKVNSVGRRSPILFQSAINAVDHAS
jgi:hypothetical protein